MHIGNFNLKLNTFVYVKNGYLIIYVAKLHPKLRIQNFFLVKKYEYYNISC